MSACLGFSSVRDQANSAGAKDEDRRCPCYAERVRLGGAINPSSQSQGQGCCESCEGC